MVSEIKLSSKFVASVLVLSALALVNGCGGDSDDIEMDQPEVTVLPEGTQTSSDNTVNGFYQIRRVFTNTDLIYPDSSTRTAVEIELSETENTLTSTYRSDFFGDSFDIETFDDEGKLTSREYRDENNDLTTTELFIYENGYVTSVVGDEYTNTFTFDGERLVARDSRTYDVTYSHDENGTVISSVRRNRNTGSLTNCNMMYENGLKTRIECYVDDLSGAEPLLVTIETQEYDANGNRTYSKETLYEIFEGELAQVAIGEPIQTYETEIEYTTTDRLVPNASLRLETYFPER